MHKLPSQDALISALTRGKKPVSILVGSPLSAPNTATSPGVPTVSGVLEVIKRHVSAAGLEENYLDCVDDNNGIARYQKSFAFIRDWLSQDDVNQVVRDCVLNARLESSLVGDSLKLEEDLDGWYLPPGAKALGELISGSEKFSGPLLTTNFDPLLSVSIAKAGCIPIQTILHTDGKLGQQRVLNPNFRNVVHLHGYWQDSDTLHTQDQLISSRPSLKASLKRLLSERTLLVVGYGGWDDVFLSALSELMFDERAPLDVLWAFYEPNLDLIKVNHKYLLEKVEPAISRGRFRIYGNIDCNTFFPKLAELVLLNSENKIRKPNVNSAQFKNNEADFTKSNAASQSLHEIFTSDTLGSSSSKINIFKKWYPNASDANRQVRAVEQDLFLSAISNNRVVYIASDWGMGKEGFIFSLMRVKNSPLTLDCSYRINIEGITDRESFLSSAEEQLGAEIQVLAVEAAKEPNITLFIDGVANHTSDEPGTDSWLLILNEIISALIDFSPTLKIVLSGRQELGDINFPSVKLEPLDEADVYAYITEHSNGGENLARGRSFEVLYRLSNGLPVRLDYLLSELTILSLDELIEAESRYINANTSEPVPVDLDRAIKRLATSTDEHQKRSYLLLEVLSVLEYGESLSNIKRFDNAKPFFPSHIRELRDLGLLTTTSFYKDAPIISDAKVVAQEELAKIHSVQPLVRNQILKTLDDGDLNHIVERSTDLTFSAKWREGKIKLSSSAQQHLKDTSRSGAGNPNLLAIQTLRRAVENEIDVEIKRAFIIGETYCGMLEKNGKYRDVVISAKELLTIAKTVSAIINPAKLLLIYGGSLRMTGKREEAIDVLEEAISYNSLSRDSKESAYVDIALAYESMGEMQSAIAAAKIILKTAKKGSGIYLQASSIIIKADEKDKKTSRCSSLEKKARSAGEFITANNLALTIAESSDDRNNKLALYDKVIACTSDNYNQKRAILRKGKLLALNAEMDKFSYLENKMLIDTYEYGFSQRINNFFQVSLELLWERFEREGDDPSLIRLFRYSSLLWRLEGKNEVEKEYAVKLSNYIKDEKRKIHSKSTQSSIKIYVISRIRVLLLPKNKIKQIRQKKK